MILARPGREPVFSYNQDFYNVSGRIAGRYTFFGLSLCMFKAVFCVKDQLCDQLCDNTPHGRLNQVLGTFCSIGGVHQQNFSEFVLQNKLSLHESC